MDPIRKATIAVVVSWTAMFVAVGTGLWVQSRVRAEDCRHERQERAALTAVLVDTFDDLGAELGAPEDRVSVFTDRITTRIEALPDPCS
jgi:hypothetical protein